MNLLLTSFGRALVQCFTARALLWSLFPLAIMAVLCTLLGWQYGAVAVTWLSVSLQGVSWLSGLWSGLGALGASWGPDVLAAGLLVLLTIPALVVIMLMLVSLVMTPRLVDWVAQQRFGTLERKQGGNFWRSVLWVLGSTVLALLALVLSIPLWFIPPLMLVVPPLVWGWLTYRTMAFDALSEHASTQERQVLLQRHRMQLLAMGVACGVAGAAPSVVWASGVIFVALFWVLVPLAIWIYALVFVLSSLWFAHFCLQALAQLRGQGEAN